MIGREHDPESLVDPEEAAIEFVEALAAERAAWDDPATDGAHESFRRPSPGPGEVERVFREFWTPILRDEGGAVSLEKLKAELFDLHHLIHAAPAVYRHVTGGLTDDPTASAEGVIAAADRRLAQLTEGLRELLGRREVELERERERIASLRAVQRAATVVARVRAEDDPTDGPGPWCLVAESDIDDLRDALGRAK